MLHSRTFGHGANGDVLLLHGLFGSLENVATLARSLAREFTVHAVDLPNHGRSERLPNAGLADYALAIASWVRGQNISRLSLVGHSLGGKVAMELALTEPALVEKLVVLDISPVAYPERHQSIFAGLEAVPLTSISQRSDAEKILEPFVKEAAVRSFLLKNLYRNDSGFDWRMNLSELKSSYSRLISANSDGYYQAPVLFLKGAKSDYIREQHKEAVLARFPQAQMRVVADTEHWLHAEKPEQVARLIERFLLV